MAPNRNVKIRAFSLLIALVVVNLTILNSVAAPLAEATDNKQYQDFKADDIGEYVPGRLIIKLRPETTRRLYDRDRLPTSIPEINKFIDTPVLEERPLYLFPDGNTNAEIAKQYFLLRVSDEVDIPSLATKILGAADVELATPDYVASITDKSLNSLASPFMNLTSAANPNDPFFPNQWAFNDNATAQLQFPSAWEITHGSSNIVIAILDTGLDVAHPDVNGKNSGTGYDFVNNDFGVQDDQGHGTNVAGIAAASTNNGIGVAGACWNCRIMPIKVCDFAGYCPNSAVQNGIYWAADQGADVVNMSLGGPTTGFGAIIWQDAINYAHDRGVTMVAAAGNENNNLSTPYTVYPAQAEHVIAVGATNASDQRCDNEQSTCLWPWTPRGSGYGEKLDIMAPGSQSIWSTDLIGAGGYGSGDYSEAFGGTSAATPFVSGLVGLMLSLDSNLTSDEVEDIIKSTAVDLGQLGRDDYYGWGRINAYGAILATFEPESPTLLNPGNGQNSVSLQPTFSWTAVPNAASYEIEISNSPSFSANVIRGLPTGTTYTPSDTLSPNTTYYWRVRAWRGFDSGEWSSTWTFLTRDNSDTTPPFVNWLEPVDNHNIYTTNGEIVRLKVEANDNVGIVKVVFDRWDHISQQRVLIGEDTSPPYQVDFDTGTLISGPNLVNAGALDAAGNLYEEYIYIDLIEAVGDVAPPTNVQASDGTYMDKVRITWNASAGATYYEIYYTNFSDPMAFLGNTSETFFDDFTNSEGDLWAYWIKACNEVGCSGFSHSDVGYATPDPSAVPHAPTNVQASDGTLIAQVHITWEAADGATSYQIYVSEPGASNKQLSHTREGIYTFSDDSGNADGTVLEYAVKACSDAGCSDFSNFDTGYADMPILNPIDNSDNDGSYTVSWIGANTASSHTLQEQKNHGSWATIYIGDTSSQHLTDREEGIWCYRVSGYNGIQLDSPWTEPQCTNVGDIEDAIPPTINWLQPAANDDTYTVYGETVLLRVQASDNVGVSRVRFRRWDAANNQWLELGNAFGTPFEINLATGPLATGWHEIEAIAYDAAGNTAQQSIFLYREGGSTHFSNLAFIPFVRR